MAIIMARPTAPYNSSASLVTDATIDSPSEWRFLTKYLHVRLEQLWLADARTGRVLRKYSREQHDADHARLDH